MSEEAPLYTEENRPIVRRELSVERVDPFHLPIFQFNDVISDEQCDVLLDMCKEQDYVSTYGDSPNYTKASKSSNILDRIPDMKEFFELFLQDLSNQVIKQQTEGFKIGTSWCTKTEKGQCSAIHSHKNYYMSGILYLQEDNRLAIENPYQDFNHYWFEPHQLNEMNAYQSMIRTRKNSMLLLPAWIKHSIPPYEGEETRYSIVMNFYPIGEYGGPNQAMINVK